MLYNVELPNKVFTIKPAVVICFGGGGRVTTKYNKCFSGLMVENRRLCVLPGWQMNVNVNVMVEVSACNPFPTEKDRCEAE